MRRVPFDIYHKCRQFVARKRRVTRKANLPLYRRKDRLSTAELKKIYFGNKKAPKSHVCIYCGKKSGSYQIDHKKPIAKGGSNYKSNLVVACSSCNSSKHDNRIPQWLRKISSSKKPSDKSLYNRIIKYNKGKRSPIAKSVRTVRDRKRKS